MCGRFVLISDLAEITTEFGVQEISGNLQRSYNIAPGNTIAAIIDDGSKHLVLFTWGLIPSWAKDSSIGNRLINARGETVAEKSSFRAAFKTRRCLIVANGFYEWQKRGKMKTPVYVRLKSDKPFGFAGLYETWISPDEQELRTCTIITTEANELLQPIHHRMPVIVPKDQEDIWLDTDMSDTTHVFSILKPYAYNEMVAYEVSTRVNSPEHNSPDCITPVSETSG
ncbi:MAG: SOS response-associated peptidase [Deltaproteobacteria bacterium]|nr:SOS response-associated peptidase [Deltaproteobacteria bacterium]